MIEQLDDIVEELANKLAIYGACTREHPGNSNCRICWTSNLKARILAAVEIEKQLHL